MQFSKTLVSLAALALGAQAGMPIASVEFQSWEENCPIGYPPNGEPKFKAALTATPATCDKATVNRQWDIDYYSIKAILDTKDAFLCEGIEVYNTDDCSGDVKYWVPFTHSPVEQGICAPYDSLDPGFLSVRLICSRYGGAAAAALAGGSGDSEGSDGF
ncbi:Sfi1 spindle body [Penicillium atrosanguineum]|uniref:Sfi1 spindle body n=1 Tax=Penicillium atrosanguineum TaxID=1132637 RepID=UPI00238EE4B4|nr:Sfi1 spindle body [Penicillium atrosanguineum]KAJ5314480.1 Sfi1 spindle body [Penicillium atrosanguineum]